MSVPESKNFNDVLLPRATCIVNGGPAILPTNVDIISLSGLQMLEKTGFIPPNTRVKKLDRFILLVVCHVRFFDFSIDESFMATVSI
jgi:hypothetical protein